MWYSEVRKTTVRKHDSDLQLVPHIPNPEPVAMQKWLEELRQSEVDFSNLDRKFV